MIVLPKINFLNRKEKNEKADAKSQNYPAGQGASSNIYIYDFLNDVSFKGGNFGANLKPLAQDTISFGTAATRKGAKQKPAKISQEEKDAMVGKVRKEPKTRHSKQLDPCNRSSLLLAESLRNDVDFAYRRLKNDISSIFGMRVFDADDSGFNLAYEAELLGNITDKKPVLAITSRKKSAKSLSEKMGHMRLTSKKSAIENIHDIVGVRILVSNSDKKSAEYVADKLLRAVKSGWIIISEIEVYRNPVLTPAVKYDYVSEKKLDEIATAARKKVKKFEYVIRQTEFGYNAVHLRVDLPNNIKGEIQIISPRVAAFKEIEDICYKALSGKGLPKGYGRLKPAFDKIDPKIDEEAYNEFAAYTRAAYALERAKASKDKCGPFLAIPEGSRIPSKLDFNNIAKLKDEIEAAERTKEAQKMREAAIKLINELEANSN